MTFLAPQLPVAGDPAGERVRALAELDGIDVVLALPDTPLGPADVAVALDWRSAASLFSVDAARHVLLVDDFAHERMPTWRAERVPAAIAYDLPVDVIAGGEWVIEAFAQRRPGVRALLARAPLDRTVFHPPEVPRTVGLPLRILIDDSWLGEGAPSDAVAVAAEMQIGHETAVLAPGLSAADRAFALRAADVVLYLDPTAGDGAAVREAMACGAVPVVLPVGGQAEPVRVGVSGLHVQPDDVRGTARALERLAGDPDVMAGLRGGALGVADVWPGVRGAGEELRAALEEIVAAPVPEMAGWPTRLVGDALAQSAVLSLELQALTGELHRIERDEAYLAAQRVRDAWRGPRWAPVRRLARPMTGRARGRLADESADEAP